MSWQTYVRMLRTVYRPRTTLISCFSAMILSGEHLWYGLDLAAPSWGTTLLFSVMVCAVLSGEEGLGESLGEREHGAEEVLILRLTADADWARVTMRAGGAPS